MDRDSPRNSLRVGGASGFWGEAPHATAQLLTDARLDVLVYDYLAEITLSIMARARQRDANLGYATDFIADAMVPNLGEIARRGVKVLSNAGGVNPAACAAALRDEIARQGLGLNVAVVEGDDLTDRIDAIAGETEMFSGAPFPAKEKILSVNAYLGAAPVAAALNAGADIVVTGRCADSALTLAACVYAFGWTREQFDLLAAGSLAGHLLECGPQATGGNFTDWEDVPDLAGIGYPIAEMRPDGGFYIGTPEGVGGPATRESVGEQMLYEIGDPAAYILPDVVCDFTEVTLIETADGRVAVAGAKGRAPTGKLKVSVTHADGFRAGMVLNFNGRRARDKGRAYAEAMLERARARLKTLGAPDFDQTGIESFGGRPPDAETDADYEEASVTAAVRHRDARAVGVFLKELVGGALAAPPGLHFFTGAGRPKPSPVVALFSCLADAGLPGVTVAVDGKAAPFESWAASGPQAAASAPPSPPPAPPPVEPEGRAMTDVPLESLAVARSGDKGNAANIGVMARSPVHLPWIWAALTPEAVAGRFRRELEGDVERFYLPGSSSMNILLHRALGGGGVASLRNDSQGKSYAQRLLSHPIAIPADLAPNTSPDAGREASR